MVESWDEYCVYRPAVLGQRTAKRLAGSDCAFGVSVIASTPLVQVSPALHFGPVGSEQLLKAVASSEMVRTIGGLRELSVHVARRPFSTTNPSTSRSMMLTGDSTLPLQAG